MTCCSWCYDEKERLLVTVVPGCGACDGGFCKLSGSRGSDAIVVEHFTKSLTSHFLTGA